MKRSSGQSLVTVAVAMAITALLVLGTMRFLASSAKSQSSLHNRVEFDNLVAEVASVISSSNICRDIFTGKEFYADLTAHPGQKFSSLEIKLGTGQVLAKTGTQVTSSAIITDIELADIAEITANSSYLAYLRFIVDNKAKVGGDTLLRKIPLNLVTAAGSAAGLLKITSCNKAGGASTAVVAEGWTNVIARHSFTATAPGCPSGWSNLWNGYSFAFGTGHQDGMFGVDPGSAGSCLEVFKPIPFLECGTHSSADCDHETLNDVGGWFITTAQTGDPGAVTASYAALSAMASRCSVCEAPKTTLVRHSFTTTAPSCPSGWTSLWQGYSFGGVSSADNAQVSHLQSVGSCLETFKAVNFMSCDRLDRCNYYDGNDFALWMTTSNATTNFHQDPATTSLIGRCTVCTKD